MSTGSAAAGEALTASEAGTQLIARQNRHTHLPEVLVTAGVIGVEVCVDHEPDRTGIDLLDRRDDLLGERAELGVDHEHAVGAGEDTDHPTLPFQRVVVPGDLGGLDLHVAVVRLRLRANHTGCRQRCDGGQRPDTDE